MDSRYKEFIAEFESFLRNIAPDGSIVTTRQIKRWVRALDLDHPLKTSYLKYLEVSDYVNIDFDTITQHMKYLSGYYQAVSYQRRVGTGANAKCITVMHNKVKIINNGN